MSLETKNSLPLSPKLARLALVLLLAGDVGQVIAKEVSRLDLSGSISGAQEGIAEGQKMMREARFQEATARTELQQGLEDLVKEGMTKYPNATRAQVINAFKKQLPQLQWSAIE